MSPAAARWRVLAAAVTLVAACAAAAPRPAEGEAHPLRLAALAERIAKLHAQVAQGVLAERGRRALAESIDEFDAALPALARRAATAEAREAYLLLAILWKEYRIWGARAPARESLRGVVERAEEVAWIAARAARAVGAAGEDGAAQAWRAAARSQRLARVYLQRRWEGGGPAAGRGARDEVDALGETLDALLRAPGTTAEIAAELQVARTQHAFFGRAAAEIDADGWSRPQAEVIAKTGEHLLESLGRAARLYGARQPG